MFEDSAVNIEGVQCDQNIQTLSVVHINFTVSSYEQNNNTKYINIISGYRIYIINLVMDATHRYYNRNSFFTFKQ